MAASQYVLVGTAGQYHPVTNNHARRGFSPTIPRRLDGDETIGARKILWPFVIGQLFSVMMLGLSAAPAPPDDAGASALGLPLGTWRRLPC